MKVFISSVIGGFEAFRGAAAKAAGTLKHTATRAEDFGATPESPQRVCLAGVRESDVVILLMGERYGDVQPSGLSPTHEEYREARDTGKPVIVFVQEGITPEPKQAEFITEVQHWARGHYTSGFGAADDLFQGVLAQLHDFELQQQRGTVDVADLVNRAKGLIPESGSSFRHTSLCIVVTGGPLQQILRPSELESEALATDLQKDAMFGTHRILDRSEGTEVRVEENQLVIEQKSRSLLIDQLGSVRIVVPAIEERDGRSFSLPAMIEEDIKDRLRDGLAFAAQVLDRIDSKGRIRQVAPLVALLDAGSTTWRTRKEHERNPNSGAMTVHGDKTVLVNLAPGSRLRSALLAQATELAEDFVVLLRRRIKS